MNIWQTPEAESWARGFDYENYLMLFYRMQDFHKLTNNPLSKASYKDVCKFFDSDLQRAEEDK